MAGTAKDVTVSEMHQGPGDLWVITTPPVDGTPRLTLASDGTPDATTHGACIHLGAIQSAITTSIKPKIGLIELDQYEAPFDGYVTDLEASIEAEMAQTEAAKLQRALGIGTYATGSGYKHLTFGGNLAVPTLCIAAISRKRAAGGTPIAKDFSVAEIYQGPGDLWLISAAPTDAAVRVTLDAATLTPDSTAHANAVHLGGTAGEITMTVTPKLGFLTMDQIAGAVDVFIESLEAKIEAEMAQTEMAKLARVLGVGTYAGNAIPATTWKQVTFDGTVNPTAFCVAAIAKKRSDPTKAAVMCLYRVLSMGGIDITMSRKKASTYKVSFSGLLDITRTPGKQLGVFHETIT